MDGRTSQIEPENDTDLAKRGGGRGEKDKGSILSLSLLFLLSLRVISV